MELFSFLDDVNQSVSDCTLTLMVVPVLIPAEGPAAPDHLAIQISPVRRNTPSRRAVSASRSVGLAAQGRAFDQYMPMSACSNLCANQIDQGIAEEPLLRIGFWSATVIFARLAPI